MVMIRIALKALNILSGKLKVINKTAFYCIVPVLEHRIKVHKNKTFPHVSHLNSPIVSHCSDEAAAVLHLHLFYWNLE